MILSDLATRLRQLELHVAYPATERELDIYFLNRSSTRTICEMNFAMLEKVDTAEARLETGLRGLRVSRSASRCWPAVIFVRRSTLRLEEHRKGEEAGARAWRYVKQNG